MEVSYKRFIFLLLSVVSLFALTANAAPGKVTGGSMHELPNWFKNSFLDISEDIEEAQEKNKHFMVFMNLEGCPYCARMLKENFSTENKTSNFIKKYFDVINIDVKGSREIAWDEDTTVTEKELAQKLKIQYSPTILFFNYDKEVVVRVNGYRNTTDFKYILEYVQGKHYENLTLTEYLNKIEKKELYTLKDNKLFTKTKDLSAINTPLAVVFEDGSCSQCEYFHDRLLKEESVVKEISKFTVVRLDANSDEKIIDTQGNKISPKQWALDINLDYRPGILLYNDKKLISTVDALLYPFHFKELLRYVSGKHYVQYPKSYLDYLRVRQDELLKQGIDIDLGK